MTIDMDDFGCNKVLSDSCQTHDCRDKLDALHYVNNNLKVTLFAVPSQMTPELLEWCASNNSWVELAVHGFYHRHNYECDKMTYEEFDNNYKKYQGMLEDFFVKGFKAPGWQIGEEVYKWLLDHEWWVADQDYNDHRRPEGLKVYKVGDNLHFHTWDCCGNGIYESYEEAVSKIKGVEEFKFVSEVV